MASHYVGQRVSLKGQTCTVRYLGPVVNKAGEWLGVEWDDTNRGKHDGSHEGKVYFKCLSRSPTAASFLRPTQPWDSPRTFLQALTEKYMTSDAQPAEIVYISGKQAEEVGFSKYSERQAKLHGIHVLVLDRMRIKHFEPLDDQDAFTISELCHKITDLDLSGNLFETFTEVHRLCALLPKLRSLTLDGNRFSVDQRTDYGVIETVHILSLNRTFQHAEDMGRIASAFPALRTLRVANNERTDWICPVLPATLTMLDLAENQIPSLSQIKNLDSKCPNLRSLSLKNNLISHVGDRADSPPALFELDLAYNAINDWAFFNELRALRSIRSLRVTGNPVYKNLVSANGRPLTADDGYMLTIARLPGVDMLNYSKVTEKERLNSETYYLGQIALELSNVTAEDEAAVLLKHPRYRELCSEYGEPVIQRRANKSKVDPNSLAARLVNVTFVLSGDVSGDSQQQSWISEVPKSFDTYAVLGLAGKELDVSPLAVELVLETDEQDPIARDSGYDGPEWWDSSDEEGDEAISKDEDWTVRQMQLVPGTRVLGTYVEGREATIRVKLREQPP